MKAETRFWVGLGLMVFSITVRSQQPVAKYKNPNIPIEDRIDDLIGRMTLEDKFWQLYMIPGDLSDGKEKYAHGIFGFQVATKGKSASRAEQILEYRPGAPARETAELINSIQHYFVEETRLGIPIIPFDEALHGLVRQGATMFPASIALAASWDTSLVRQVAGAIAMETKTRGVRQILSPVINITRDVRWGRVEETYGEDPYLTSRMAVAFIKPFEQMGVVTTPKHFVANVGAGGRDSYPIDFDERLLQEIYFPGFKASIREAGATSLMTSYNSLHGRPCDAYDWLLNKQLKEDWGFDGFVISDANAVGGSNVLLFTAQDYTDATEQSIENGLDVIFQTAYDQYPYFYDAFEKGLIDHGAIDAAVRRVLRAKFKMGLFENPYVDPSAAEEWNGNPAHRDLAYRSALASTVLLKNEAQALPLSHNLRSIAVIGVDADEARLGGYSGPGNRKVSILEGIKNKVGTTCQVNYAPGCGRFAIEEIAIPASRFFHEKDGKKVPGLIGQYFNNITLEGHPVMTRIDPNIEFRWTLFSPNPDSTNPDFYAARWEGNLIAPETGDFKIGFYGDDGYRLYLDGQLILDNWKKQTVRTRMTAIHLDKDRTYAIRVECFQTTGNAWFRLVWNVGVDNNWQAKNAAAVDLARNADATVIVAGIEEGEFRDRSYLSLPGHQEALIRDVAATGKPVVVVLVGGSAVTMRNWIDEVPAILDVWYPGEAGGDAVADILFGDYNPGGHLPITFPEWEGQLPLYYNHRPTGRGDDYLDGTGKPLFPFGYGLSYTTFNYHDLVMGEGEIKPDQSTTVRFKVTNTGDFDGDEVVQLYIRDEVSSVSQPVLALKGFMREHIKKGETRDLSFTITPEMLQMLDEEMNWVVEPGSFRILIGSSSYDIRLRGKLNVVH